MSGEYGDGKQRIMIDIETLGLSPGAAILSIGAVRFDEYGLGYKFYREISLKSCQEAGLTIDAGMLEWWLDQDEDVSEILTGGRPLSDVLAELRDFCADGVEVWANSPSFDCDLLEAAYDAVGIDEPWDYRRERDVRTIKSLPCAAQVMMEGDEHNALDDAIYQARVVSETLQTIQSMTYQEGDR